VHFIPAQQIHFQAVFEIDHAVTEIVGGFDQIGQRVTAEMIGAALAHAGGVADFMQRIELGIEGTVFIVACGFAGTRDTR
jgi:hypothetical protein